MNAVDPPTLGVSGSLKDVSVTDVMQFIHFGRRSGTLTLTRAGERAMLGFHCGRLMSAQAPSTPRVGQMLVERGLLEPRVLDAAVAAQGSGPGRRSLGQVLVSRGAIDADALRSVVADQIKLAVNEVLVWDTGTFDFAVDDLSPIDDIVLYPSDVLPEPDVNTQMVLLEAARLFDERSRAGRGSGGAEGRGQTPKGGPAAAAREGPPPRAAASEGRAAAAPGGSLDAAIDRIGARDGDASAIPRVFVRFLSSDEILGTRLAEALAPGGVKVERVDPVAGGEHGSDGVTPVVVVDLRPGGTSLEAVERLRLAWPQAPLVAVVDGTIDLGRVYGTGVLAALPAEVDAIGACVRNVVRGRPDLVHDGTRAGGASGVARLQRVFGELRSGLMSATMALSLMHIISESVQRAVLFLVKGEELVALGAFGRGAGGGHLAQLTRGLHLPAGREDALGRSLRTGEIQSLSFEDAALPEPLAAQVGRPRNGQVVVFPVLGAQRVIAVVYADNDSRDEIIQDIDILELATSQVGIAFENELLRRQMSSDRRG